MPGAAVDAVVDRTGFRFTDALFPDALAYPQLSQGVFLGIGRLAGTTGAVAHPLIIDQS